MTCGEPGPGATPKMGWVGTGATWGGGAGGCGLSHWGWLGVECVLRGAGCMGVSMGV